MPRALFALLLFPVASRAADPDPRSLAVPPADRARAAELVRALGSPAFDLRDQATRDLRALARLALPALTAATAHPDPEVRMRAGLLLPAARQDDLAARLACLLADTAAKYDHDVPGWNGFKAAAGDGPERRAFFAKLLDDPANRDLVAATAGGVSELNRRLDDRQRELYLRMYPPPLPVPAGEQRPEPKPPTAHDVAALLLAESAAGDRPAPRVGAVVTPYSLFGRTSARAALFDGPDGEVLRKLTGAWMGTRKGAMALYQAAMIAQYRDLPEGVAVAAKLIAVDGATPAQRATAAATVAKVGKPADWKVLVPLFADETPLRAGLGVGVGGNGDGQVRDVALAMAAHVAGRDPAEFGIRGRISSTGSRLYYYNLSFASDEDRAKGFAKWAEIEPTLPTGKD